MQEVCFNRTVGALVRGHPSNTQKVSITGKCKNVEFVWELRVTGFCERGRE